MYKPLGKGKLMVLSINQVSRRVIFIIEKLSISIQS